MILDNVTRFELYRDSSASDPHEDPERIRERVEALATEADAEVETVDLAGRSKAERSEIMSSVRSRVGEDRPYVVDNRMFRPDTFGSRRPVLLIEYEDAPADLYPHRNYDVDEMVPIDVLDALDELEGDGAADLERIHSEDGGEEDGEDDVITSPIGAAEEIASKAVSSVTSS